MRKIKTKALTSKLLRIGIAADHGGFELKVQLTATLKAAGYKVTDFGAHELVTGDDYPDFVAPLARAVGTFIRFRILLGSWFGAAYDCGADGHVDHCGIGRRHCGGWPERDWGRFVQHRDPQRQHNAVRDRDQGRQVCPDCSRI